MKSNFTYLPTNQASMLAANIEPHHIADLLSTAVGLAWIKLPVSERNAQRLRTAMDDIYNRTMQNFLHDLEVFSNRGESDDLK
jgi:hypothetical protein